MRKKWYNTLVVSLIFKLLVRTFVLLLTWSCLSLTGYSNVVDPYIPAGPTLDTDGPELFLNEAEATPVIEMDVESPEGSSPNGIKELLAVERQRASHFLKRLEVENSFVARLAVKLPIVVEEVTEKVTESVAELKEKVSDQVDIVAEKVKSREEQSPDISEIDRLPLSDLTADTGLMKRAKVSFDKKTDTWLAVWKKPAVFHFGMILHPELLEQVQNGEKLHFESKGMKLALLRSEGDKLMVEQSNGKRHELGAKRLEGLLRRSISVDGLDLFLDSGGNLVLRAAGEQARSLATRLGSS